MVYQHELNHMMYQYFNQTNQAMREFAEENTQRVNQQVLEFHIRAEKPDLNDQKDHLFFKLF